MEVNNILALQEAEKYLSHEDPIYIAAVNNLGVVYSRIKQDHQKALSLYIDALNQFNNSNLHVAIKGTLLNNIGQEYRQMGDFDNAILYHKEALQYFQQAFKGYLKKNARAYFKFAEVYNALAKLYEFQKDYTTAIFYLEEELALLHTAGQKFDVTYFFYVYLYLAEISIKQNKLDVAKNYLEKALVFGPLSSSQKAKIFTTYATLNLQKNKYDIAESYIDKALLNIPEEQSIELAKARHLKGQIEVQKRKYIDALKSLDQAISLLIPSARLDQLDSLQGNIKILSRIDLIHILSTKAKTLEAYYQKTADTGLLEEALQVYLMISHLSDQLRQNYQSEESKIFLNETTFDFYEDALHIIYQLYQITENTRYVEQAFFFSEKSKSTALLDELMVKEAEVAFAIPEFIREQFYHLRAEINYYQKLLRQTSKYEKSSLKEQKWNSQLLLARQEYAVLNEKLKISYPNYYRFTQSQIISAIDFQDQILMPHQVLIECFMGKKKGYVFVISKENTQFYKLESVNDISEKLAILLEDIKMFDPQKGFGKSSHYLFQKLIQPLGLPKNVSHLLIVPDGKLAYLPFELLLQRESGTHNPKEMSFLIRDYCISYAYSGTVLLTQLKSEIKSSSILAIAPVFENQPGKYLRYSQEELSAFEALNSKILLNEQATKMNFLSKWNEFEILHIASHASSSDSISQQPTIDFWDGKIFLTDLYTFNAHPQLVVLSACESGIGNFHKGEGILSLARGFTYAGAQSIITTLWQVNDKSTSEIVKKFYEYLKEGFKKDDALRKAKLDYLQDCTDDKAAPFYWASFIQLGDSRAVKLKQQTPLVWIWGMGISILFFLIYLKKRYQFF